MNSFSPTPWLIARSTHPQVCNDSHQVVLLPWGATEAHGKHLPYATDTLQVEALAADAARRAWDAGARVAVLPAIPFGVQTGQLDLPLCINLNPSTQAIILHDILKSLDAMKASKFVLLNGHGGNDFRQMLRELQPRFPRLFLSAVSWFAIDTVVPRFDNPGDHADERETSLMLHLHPELVRPREEWGEGSTNAWTIDALNRKWAWAQRTWTRATNDTGAGDPRAATAEKGRVYFDALSEKLSRYLIDLARTPLERLYEPPTT